MPLHHECICSRKLSIFLVHFLPNPVHRISTFAEKRAEKPDCVVWHEPQATGKCIYWFQECGVAYSRASHAISRAAGHFQHFLTP
jgi:hypothetical protein